MSDGIIARGRIKVDARKALDKLRDHMLVDPHLWACEIARVAVALGATFLHADWDADNLTFDFDGRALAPDAIAHARDHVLTPIEGTEGDALRALGIGIGAALSLDPAFVDVIARDGATAMRVRFERRYIDEQDTAPPAEPIALPGLMKGATRVHFKRRLGLQSISRSLRNEIPAEIPHLQAALDTPQIELRVRGAPVARRPTPVLTVDLDVPGTTRARLEVLRHSAAPQTDFLSYGVRISSYAIRGCWGLAINENALLPIRVVVDAPDVPMNASRSQVRTDHELVQRVFARITPAFAIAVSALRNESTAIDARIGHAVTVHADPSIRADVLGEIAALAALACRRGDAVEPAARQLLNLPVLADAHGRPMLLSTIRGGTRELPIRVYDGPTPLPEALAPWFGTTVWRRGLSAERVLKELEVTSIKELIGPAMLALKRRERALTHEPSPPVVATSSATAWKESFSVASGAFAGLAGEIGFGTEATKELATARLFVDAHALETVPLPGVRLPLTLAITWPGQIIARFEYDAVERNDALSRAIQYVLRLAALAIGARTEDAEIVRRAIVTCAEVTQALGDGVRLGPLGQRQVWRTNEGRLVSFDAIAAYAVRTGAICWASVPTPAADGRIVVGAVDFPALRGILPAKTAFIPYGRALSAGQEVPEPLPSVSIAIHQPMLDGFVTPSRGGAKTSKLRVYHAGVRIRSESWAAHNGPVEVVLNDRAAVPTTDHAGAVWSSPLVGLTKEEDALVLAVIEVCERDGAELATFEGYLDESRARFAERNEHASLRARIEDLPARRERLRLERLKEVLLARAPIDLDALLSGRLRGTVVAPKRGAVTVALGPPGPFQVLYAGHPLGTATIGRLPVEGWVDVVLEAFVEEWDRLSVEGTRWAEGALIDASLTLVEKLTLRDGFAHNTLALELMLGLLTESPARAQSILARTPWPTVQGTTMQIGHETQVSAGVNRYDAWLRAEDTSPYDAPALHIPMTKAGELRNRVLIAAGITITDVTDPIARLQALRAKGRHGGPPKLDGDPPHPLLRRSLAELGATLVEGELELVDGTESSFSFIDSTGVRELTLLDIGAPVRVVYRAETNDLLSVAREVASATKKLLESIERDLDRLPPFVRRCQRGRVCASVANTSALVDRDKDLPIFESILPDRWHSLGALNGTIAYTTDPPPYPPYDDIVLRLDFGEAAALSRAVALQDVTGWLRTIRRGHERRTAPPLEEIVLGPAVRAQCIFVIPVDEEGVKGEIGLLHPSHATSRRIDLFTTMRPLATILDPEGWPLIGALNDDGLLADAAFAGFAEEKRVITRLHQLLRRIVGASLGQLLPAPPDVLGVVRLPCPFLIRSVQGPSRLVGALGVFWLPKEWPERPGIHVEAVGIIDRDRLPLIAPAPDAQSTVVPVGGRIWITADAHGLDRSLEHVMAWVSLRLSAHVRSHANVDRYRWDLALLGALDEPGVDPVKELALDRPDPDLMHVAARRAPHLIDKTTGDAPTAPVHVVQAAPLPDAIPPPLELERPSISPAPPAESFFFGLVRRVTELVSVSPEPYVESPLTAAIAHSLAAMMLTGDPVIGVRESKRGRPVVYDRASKHVVINAAHPIVRAHVATPNGVLFLVLAALSEINRELVEVTDAEETAKVLDLLRANA